MEESGKPAPSKKKKGIIAGSIIAIIIVVVLLIYLLSPSLSPIASIRDTDGDGVADNEDAFPNEPTQWSDIDFDGYGDNPNGRNPDAFPNNPLEWTDTDGDSHGDNSDIRPNDPVYWAEGIANINVTLESDHIWYDIHYKLYVNNDF